jgi:hypothetical protein
MSAHFFLIEELAPFLANLQTRHYLRSQAAGWTTYSKSHSKAIIKHYSFIPGRADETPVQIRVSYDLLNQGQPLKKIVRELKNLIHRYRQTFPSVTRPATRKNVREHRWHDLQSFLQQHEELIGCFRYDADDRLTEGTHTFNLQVASTPTEQRICLEFIKALAEAHMPDGLVRGRRTADKPVQQRNGWIRRYAQLHKKRGWGALEIAHEIQKQLRTGTWNERSRLQYNIANNTICKIAGIKIPQSTGAFR